MGLPDHRLQGFEPPGSVRGFAPKPGVALGSAQPRALWHNAVGVGEGDCLGVGALTDLVRCACGKELTGLGEGGPFCKPGEKWEWEPNLAQSGRGAEKENLGSPRLGVSAR